MPQNPIIMLRITKIWYTLPEAAELVPSNALSHPPGPVSAVVWRFLSPQ